MGEVIKIACESCRSEWQCHIGCGLSHALLQDVVREFPKEIGKKIMEEAGEELPIFEFAYRISACGGCGNVVSVPVLKFEEKNAEYIGPCPVCGDGVSLIKDINDTGCPACKSKALKAESVGLWD